MDEWQGQVAWHRNRQCWSCIWHNALPMLPCTNQGRHSVLPSLSWYQPAGQRWQLTVPVVLAKVPWGQSPQMPAPALGWYFPRPHSLHSVCPI